MDIFEEHTKEYFSPSEWEMYSSGKEYHELGRDEYLEKYGSLPTDWELTTYERISTIIEAGFSAKEPERPITCTELGKEQRELETHAKRTAKDKTQVRKNAQATQRLNAKRLHKRNQRICLRCGSRNTCDTGRGVKVSYAGAAIGYLVSRDWLSRSHALRHPRSSQTAMCRLRQDLENQVVTGRHEQTDRDGDRA